MKNKLTAVHITTTDAGTIAVFFRTNLMCIHNIYSLDRLITCLENVAESVTYTIKKTYIRIEYHIEIDPRELPYRRHDR